MFDLLSNKIAQNQQDKKFYSYLRQYFDTLNISSILVKLFFKKTSYVLIFGTQCIVWLLHLDITLTKIAISPKKIATNFSQQINRFIHLNKTSVPTTSKYFSKSLKLKFAPNIIRVLFAPEFAVSRIAAIMLS